MNYSDSKISIIVPVYNVEQFLPKCLNSLVNQTYKNIEIICVNDGSLDNSQDILGRFAETDNRIRVFQKQNGGLSSARNYAHQFVTGKYIMYVDSDDWLELDTCETAVREAEANDADVVFWNYVREIGDLSKPRYILGTEQKVFETKDDIKKLHRRFVGLYAEELAHPETANSLDTAWGKLYRAGVILNNDLKFIDTKIIGTEDALFNLYAFGHVSKAVYISKCYNHYRKDNGISLTKTYKKDLKQQWDNLYDYMSQYIAVNHCDDTYRRALDNRICLSIIGLGMNIVRGDKTVDKLNEIKKILSSEEYRRAVGSLSLKYFPVYWKMFFGFAKHNFALGIYFMLVIIRKLKGN